MKRAKVEYEDNANHVAQEMGLLMKGEWGPDKESLTRVIFWFVEGEVAIASFIGAFALRMLTGWRISRYGQVGAAATRLQIPLLNLFLLTALVCVLFAAIRTEWVQTHFKHDGYEILHQIVLYSLAIGLSLMPAGVILRHRFGPLAIGLMIASWVVLPFLLQHGAQGVGWIHFGGMVHPLSTTVAGSAAAALIAAFEFRKLGFRWQTWVPTTEPQ